ncbi:CWC16 protein [Zalerion maritima]|uniref:Splicing factor YJU2 n=1 Tax=Zalerion maritima TaxID=339359 RepID=A0AAD5RTN9_9PEZI|nr:CWC16 protein [Zalerion maritima]
MSERKVLSKYYPPDFDPSALTRRRGGPKPAGPKVQTVRVAAPFSMRCTSCGEYIYKGRKFNARKETPQEERYLGIQIFRFYIRCTRCSAEITYKTDPKNNDYAMEKGAKRNTEPWRQQELADETDEQRLDRLEREMAEEEENEEKNAMAELEQATADAHRDMAVADALDKIRSRTALREKAAKDGVDLAAPAVADTTLEEERTRRRQDEEDAEYARRAIAEARARELEEKEKERKREEGRRKQPAMPQPQKRKLDAPSMPALKLLKKATSNAAAAAATKPAPVEQKGPLVAYGSDSDDE